MLACKEPILIPPPKTTSYTHRFNNPSDQPPRIEDEPVDIDAIDIE